MEHEKYNNILIEKKRKFTHSSEILDNEPNEMGRSPEKLLKERSLHYEAWLHNVQYKTIFHRVQLTEMG